MSTILVPEEADHLDKLSWQPFAAGYKWLYLHCSGNYSSDNAITMSLEIAKACIARLPVGMCGFAAGVKSYVVGTFLYIIDFLTIL